MTTLGSPASFRPLSHVFLDFHDAEITELIHGFCQGVEINLDDYDWINNWNSVKELSFIDDGEEPPGFHVGVVMRCMIDLEDQLKVPGIDFSGKTNQYRLRKPEFLLGFDRCFAVDSTTIKGAALRQSNTDILMNSFHFDSLPEHLLPFVRAGVLSLRCRFTCQAAHWLNNNNTVHFSQSGAGIPE